MYQIQWSWLKGKGDSRQVIKGKGKQKGKKGKSKGFGKKGKMSEVGYENDYDGTDMWWQDDGSWWEDQSWLETSQVWNGNWDESWDSAWNEGQEDGNDAWSWPVGEDAVHDGSAGGTAPGVQSLVLSPLISDMFASVCTGLTFETDSSEECSDVFTHFSTDETVCEVSISGLQCLEGNKVFCRCGNCMEISDEFGANLERCQLRNVRLNHFFNNLPSELFRFPPEFFESEPLFESDTDSASSCVVDVPGTGHELGDSEENLDTAACQLCILKSKDNSCFVLIHIDDILVVGKRDFVMNKLLKRLQTKYEVLTQVMQAPGDEITFLKRRMVLQHDSRLTVQMHHKHVDQMCSLLGLNKKLQGKKSPGHADMDQIDSTGEVSPQMAKTFRTCIGILLYLAPDLPHSANMLSGTLQRTALSQQSKALQCSNIWCRISQDMRTYACH